VATDRRRKPGGVGSPRYIGRDPIKQRSRQVSRGVQPGPRPRIGEPPKAGKDLAHRIESEAAAGKLGGTSASVGLPIDRHLEHLERAACISSRLSASGLRPALCSLTVVPVNV
jgi:hypothetical protein